MNWKLVSAFAAGTVLASVIVYFAVRPAANVAEPPRVAAVQKATPAPPPPTPTPVSRVPAPVATKHVAPVRPVREKPSPFHPPDAQERPATIAKYVPPPNPIPEPEPVVTPAPVQNVPVAKVSNPTPKPEPRVAPSVTLNFGTLLPVRMGQALSSARTQAGDTFFATLARPLVVDGWVIAESGARVEGHVEEKGLQNLRISIVRVVTSDGQNVRIHTEPYVKVPLAEIPVGAQITFKVLDPVTITERVN